MKPLRFIIRISRKENRKGRREEEERKLYKRDLI